MRLLPLLLILGACASPRADGPTRDQAEFSQELAGRAEGAPQTCIPATSSSSLTIVDNRTLTYRQGGTIWVNRLKADCPGLRPMDTLVVEAQGSQYCRSDRFRSVVPGTTIPGPICFLGDFIPYRRH